MKHLRHPLSRPNDFGHWTLGFGHPRPILIATFGTARLVRKLDGRHELIGGTPADLTAAREWCSMYAHDLVFSAAHEWPVRLGPRWRSFAA